MLGCGTIPASGPSSFTPVASSARATTSGRARPTPRSIAWPACALPIGRYRLGDAGLVARARANAAGNQIGNAEFHLADLTGDPGALPWLPGTCQRVLLDPPRAGAAGVLPLIARLRPARVVYVSCHPASLARDAGTLVNDHGFRLAAAGVMDMFPHTAHVESVAIFEPG